MQCRDFRYCALPGAAFALLLTTAFGAAAQTMPAIEAYAGHALYSGAALSPDGDSLALIVPRDGGDQAVTISFANPENRKAYSFENAIINDVEWYGNETVFVQTYGRYTVLSGVSFGAQILYPGSDERSNFVEYIPFVIGSEIGSDFAWTLDDVIDLAPHEDGYVLMSAHVYRQPGVQLWGSSVPKIWAYDLLQVFVENGQAREFIRGTEETGQWITNGNGNGNIMARIDVRNTGRQAIMVPDGTSYREIASLDDHPDNRGEIMGLSLDGNSLVVRMRRGPRIGPYPLSLSDGSIGEPVYYNDAFDIGTVLYDERTRRVNGIAYQQEMLVRYEYFDPELQALQETLESAFSGHSFGLISRSDGGGKVLFQIVSPTRPPTLGIFDSEALTAETVSEAYPELVGAPFGEARVVPYTAPDGSALFGILTLPPEAAAQGLPLVVLEDASTAPTFDRFAQFLASRGYAVFRPGIRQLRRIGELSGMGELNDWVLSMGEDYAAGVETLVADGIADPGRICIYGAGDGAYTALMSAILSAGTYRCAIGVNPLTDLQRLVEWARFASDFSRTSYTSPLVRNFDEYAEEDIERLSPLARAAEMDANVLLVGFERDSQVPAMEAALTRAHRPVEFVAFEGDPNEVAAAREENAILTYRAVESFLAEQFAQ